VFALIGQIQEETHRFAIEYHRQLQAGHVKTSVLDKISGVGEKRRQQLLKHFKTIKAIKAASLEQLQEVVPKNTAQAVYDYFHGGE
jgi:excinuclease ABC subunit C